MRSTTTSARLGLRRALSILALAAAIGIEGSAFAGIFHVALDTAGLAGQTGQLAFSFIDGDAASPNNTAAVTSFASNGVLGGVTLTSGLASGNLSASVALQDAPSTIFIQALTFGTTLSFDFSITDEHAPPFFPDQLAFFVLSSDLSGFLVTTSDATGANALFVLDVTGAPGGLLTVNEAFIDDAPTEVSVTPGASVAEPGVLPLFALGVAMMLARRRSTKGGRIVQRRSKTWLRYAALLGALLGSLAHAQVLYFVTNTNDSGPGSLRQAIANANANPGTDGIDFSLDFSTPKTIILTGGTLSITGSVDIFGPGPAKLTLLGNGSSRVLLVGAGTTVFLDGLTITNGRATSGGGISNAGTLTIGNSTIVRNEATDDGGGIANSGVLTIVDSTVSNNLSDDSAGGIYNRATGVLTLRNSSVFANVVTGGGGGGLVTLGVATIVNSTISGNLADNTPGGIGAGGTVTILDSTIAGNLPGNIDNIDASVTIGNSIVAYGIFAPNCAGPIASVGHNISSDATCFNPFAVASDRANTNPKLIVLANNGGPTMTHALAVDSPAVNAGNNGLVPAGVTTDQRGAGFPRVVNGTVDIGAVESQFAPAPSATGAVSVVQGGFRKDFVTGRYVQLVTLSNAGTVTVSGPISLILDNLTPGVSLYQPSGTASNASPYKNANLGADGVLTAGERVTVTLEFVNPLAKSIVYTLRVVAGTGPR